MAKIICNTMEEAEAIENPKHIWINGTEIIVYTEEDTPIIPKIISVREFRNRFTENELEAMLNLAYSGDVTARKLLLKLQTIGETLDLENPSIIAGMDYWVTNNVLTAERAEEILTY